MNLALFSKNLGKYLEKSQTLCTGFIYLGNDISFKKSSDPLGEASMTVQMPHQNPFQRALTMQIWERVILTLCSRGIRLILYPHTKWHLQVLSRWLAVE